MSRCATTEPAIVSAGMLIALTPTKRATTVPCAAPAAVPSFCGVHTKHQRCAEMVSVALPVFRQCSTVSGFLGTRATQVPDRIGWRDCPTLFRKQPSRQRHGQHRIQLAFPHADQAD